jgi:hypothetical protein
MIWAAVGTAMSAPAVLWALALFAALGAVLLSHPSCRDYHPSNSRSAIAAAPSLPRYEEE